jgi:hypothetical protein
MLAEIHCMRRTVRYSSWVVHGNVKTITKQHTSRITKFMDKCKETGKKEHVEG